MPACILAVFFCKHFTDQLPDIPWQNQCSLPGPLRPGQEVANPLVQEALLERSLPSGEHFTSIVHTTLDNSNFVFAGTNGGNLYQVWSKQQSYKYVVNLKASCSTLNFQVVKVSWVLEYTQVLLSESWLLWANIWLCTTNGKSIVLEQMKRDITSQGCFQTAMTSPVWLLTH